jgi:hypothetical protein
MKKILIPILVLSLNSCTLFYKKLKPKEIKQVEENHGCDLSEHTAGYHIHSGTYVEEGETKVWVIRVDNNDECKYCREE